MSRTTLGRLAGLALSVLAALALGEAALRVAGFGFAIAPEAVEFGWPDPVVMERRYRSDPDLFWVTRDYPERLARLAEARPDVVFMGDSCTEFSDYPGRVVTMLRARRPGRRLVGANLGVGGWSSFQGLQQMRRDVVGLAPRAVTVYYGWNDHWVGFGVEDAEVARLSSTWLGRLEALRLAQLVFKTRLVIAARDASRPNRVPPHDFRSNLEEIVGLARESGIQAVLLTAPTSHRRGHEPARLGERWLRDLDDLVPLHRSYAGIVREVAARDGAKLCDLLQAFDGLAPVDRDAAFWDDGIHLTAEGSRRVAGLLAECLRDVL